MKIRVKNVHGIGALLSILLFIIISSPCNATLVGYWNFDEGSGPIAHDNSGFGNDGMITGASWVDGKDGGALSFDGIDDYVTVLNSPSINVNTFTVSFWASFNDVDRTQVLLDKRNGQWHHNYEFVYYADDPQPTGTPDDYLSANIGDGTFHPTNYDNAAFTSVNFCENRFYYFSATYDQSVLKLYINGQEMDERYITMLGIIGDGDLLIGRHGSSFDSSFFGIIDELRIYDNALTKGQIIQDMRAPVPEPATILLVFSGILGIAYMNKRSKKGIE